MNAAHLEAQISDRQLIAILLGLPDRSVIGVERRRDRSYALLIDTRRIRRWLAQHPEDYRRLRPVMGRRVLRVPRCCVQPKRRGRHTRNRRMALWAVTTFPFSPAAEMRAGAIDGLRAAIGRESLRGEFRRGGGVLAHCFLATEDDQGDQG